MITTESFILSDTQLPQLVEKLVALSATKRIFTFTGTLGAGKTTLIQAVCRKLGITEPIASPTYTYMNIYKTPTLTVYHFDLYRLSSYDSFIDLGFDEYLNAPHSICLIEWPEIVVPVLPSQTTCSVAIDYHEKKREYTLSYE